MSDHQHLQVQANQRTRIHEVALTLWGQAPSSLDPQFAPDFAAAYRAAWGEDADGCRAVLAHDAVLALARALESLGPLSDPDLRAGLASTRERLRLALRGVQVRGAAGPLRFDQHGDVRRRVPVLRVDPLPQGGYAPRLELLMGEG